MRAIIVHISSLPQMLGLGEWGPSLVELQLILNCILLWLTGFILCKIADRLGKKTPRTR